jgi:acyl carrier protein
MNVATHTDTIEQSTIEQRLRVYLTEHILFSDHFPYSDETSFLDSGIVDSMNVMEIVHHTEQAYGIRISDHEIVPDNFDSIQNIARFIRNKTSKGGAALAASVGPG